jgi:hypothetical protein
MAKPRLLTREEEVMQIKKRTAISLTLCLALVLGLGYATTTLASEAAKTDKPADWKFHSIVDVDFVSQQVKVPMPEDVMIIDSRPKQAKYDKGHIPMAFNIPDSKFDKMTDKLPADKCAAYFLLPGAYLKAESQIRLEGGKARL